MHGFITTSLCSLSNHMIYIPFTKRQSWHNCKMICRKAKVTKDKIMRNLVSSNLRKWAFTDFESRIDFHNWPNPDGGQAQQNQLLAQLGDLEMRYSVEIKSYIREAVLTLEASLKVGCRELDMKTSHKMSKIPTKKLDSSKSLTSLNLFLFGVSLLVTGL